MNLYTDIDLEEMEIKGYGSRVSVKAERSRLEVKDKRLKQIIFELLSSKAN